MKNAMEMLFDVQWVATRTRTSWQVNRATGCSVQGQNFISGSGIDCVWSCALHRALIVSLRVKEHLSVLKNDQKVACGLKAQFKTSEVLFSAPFYLLSSKKAPYRLLF
jgi:hypothetical protein